MSMATPAPTVAITVPSPVIPLTATLNVVPSLGAISVTSAVVGFADPFRVTSPVVKSVTGSLNTTVKFMGEVAVGSACAVACSMVTVGGVLSAITVKIQAGFTVGIYSFELFPTQYCMSLIMAAICCLLPVSATDGSEEQSNCQLSTSVSIACTRSALTPLINWSGNADSSLLILAPSQSASSVTPTSILL